MAKNKKGKRKVRNSLSGKIIIIMVAFMLACSVLWTTVMFINMSRNAKTNTLNDEEIYMQALDSNAKSVEEVCNLAEQVVSQMSSVTEYIERLQAGNDLDSVEKIEFYNNEIESINEMTNVNPYLYEIRLYVNAKVTEKKPCFYSIDRMTKMEWANDYVSGEWQINYSDSVFQTTGNNDVKLAGIITDLRDDEGNLLAVLEVSTKIENLIDGFYGDENEGDYCCFIDSDSSFICAEGQEQLWLDNKDQVLNLIAEYDDESTSFITEINGGDCVVSILKMSSLKGALVHISDISDTLMSYYRSQSLYILVVLISVAVFIVIVIILITNIFKRFNILISDVNKVKDGGNIKVSESGDDELAEVGKQINEMLESLNKLNRENINKQILVKNAEIKALQNQIDAHFMFNVLETIKMMAEIKGEYDISDAVTALGNLFRYTVKWTDGMVALRNEIEYVKNYLDLLNLRFDYEIFLSLNIPDEFMDFKIPKMSIQPIVENSVSHGIETLAEDTYIYIKVYEKDNVVNIEVSDAGVGMDEDTLNQLRKRLDSTDYSVDDEKEHGRALYNVQQRIKLYFGPEYGLEIFSKQGVYTKVLIKMPYR